MPGAGENNTDPNNANGGQTGAGDQNPPANANGTGGQGGDGGGEDDLGEFSDPKKAVAEIKRLRQENAQRRTTAKDLETKFNALNAKMEKLSKAFGGEEEVDPEEKLNQLKVQYESLEIESSMNHLARVYAIPVDQDDYFRFLLSQRFQALEEGEELGEEEMKEIVAKVKAVSPGGGGKPNGTGVDGQKPNPQGGGSEVTVAQFVKMGTAEKSALYSKNPALYEKLRQEANTLK